MNDGGEKGGVAVEKKCNITKTNRYFRIMESINEDIDIMESINEDVDIS